MIVGAGDRPCVVIAAGARIEAPASEPRIVYPVDEAALKHGAGVEQEAHSGQEAYARFARPKQGRYREGHLPEGRARMARTPS